MIIIIIINCIYVVLCFLIWHNTTCGILYSYRRVCTVRGEMCGFPLTRSGRRHRRCCVVPRSTTTRHPTTPFPRSNGSRGVPSGILLTTHSIPTLPLCTRAFLYVHSYEVCLYIYIHSHIRPPRLGHVGTKVPFIALLAYRVSPLLTKSHNFVFRRPSNPLLLSFQTMSPLCVCTFTNVYNRVLPGTCSRRAYA